MNALERFTGGSISPWGGGARGIAKDLQTVQREVLVALAQDAGLAEYTWQEMGNTLALDQFRQQLAGDNEFLNRLLAQEEISYVMESLNIKRSMFKPWSA
jgi:protein-disulfide isomerase-like protein with CxxC motif